MTATRARFHLTDDRQRARRENCPMTRVINITIHGTTSPVPRESLFGLLSSPPRTIKSGPFISLFCAGPTSLAPSSSFFNGFAAKVRRLDPTSLQWGGIPIRKPTPEAALTSPRGDAPSSASPPAPLKNPRVAHDFRLISADNNSSPCQKKSGTE